MGYSSGALRHIEDVLASLQKSTQMHVLELGAQEINYDVPPSTVFHFIYRLNPTFQKADEIARLLPGLLCRSGVSRSRYPLRMH